MFDVPGTYSLLLSANDGSVTITDTLIVDVVPSTPELPPDPTITGNLDVFGDDSNGNQIRDDIERFISANYRSDPVLVDALNLLAKGYQNALNPSFYPDADDVAIDSIVRATNCIHELDTQDMFDPSLSVFSEQLNTIERYEAYGEFETQVDGVVVVHSRSDDPINPCTILD